MTMYKISSTIEIDDIVMAVLVSVGDPYDEQRLAIFIDELLLDNSGGLIIHSDVLVSEVKDEI